MVWLIIDGWELPFGRSMAHGYWIGGRWWDSMTWRWFCDVLEREWWVLKGNQVWETRNRTGNSSLREHPVCSSKEAHWNPRLAIRSSETLDHSSEQARWDEGASRAKFPRLFSFCTFNYPWAPLTSHVNPYWCAQHDSRAGLNLDPCTQSRV